MDLSKISDIGMQAHKLAEHLKAHAPESSIEQLHEELCLALSGNDSARTLFNPVVLTQAILEILSAEERLSLYESARQMDRPLVAALFADYTLHVQEPPIETMRIPDVRADPGKDPITLGERRALAKTQDQKVLEKMLLDPDPRVIRNLLSNPYFLEKHALKLASQRPHRGEILRLMARHPRWGSNLRIRRALVLNPYTPPVISVLTLLALPKQEIKEVMNDGNLHPILAEVAREILDLVSGC